MLPDYIADKYHQRRFAELLEEGARERLAARVGPEAGSLFRRLGDRARRAIYSAARPRSGRMEAREGQAL